MTAYNSPERLVFDAQDDMCCLIAELVSEALEQDKPLPTLADQTGLSVGDLRRWLVQGDYETFDVEVLFRIAMALGYNIKLRLAAEGQ